MFKMKNETRNVLNGCVNRGGVKDINTCHLTILEKSTKANTFRGEHHRDIDNRCTEGMNNNRKLKQDAVNIDAIGKRKRYTIYNINLGSKS